MYGIIRDGILELSSTADGGYKPVEYAEIPTFDQATQYVRQKEPVDAGEKIIVGVEIKTLDPVPDQGDGFEY